MKCVMCCVQYEKNDNACYSRSMTFPKPIWQVQLTGLSITHIIRINLSLIMYVLGV